MSRKSWQDALIAAVAQRVARVRAPGRLSLLHPERPRCTIITNQKGGVGKTASVVNVASALARYGPKVLVINNDPQGNAPTVLGIKHVPGAPSMHELLIDELQINDVIRHSPESENLFCVPATLDLAGPEIRLVSLLNHERWLLDTVPNQYLIDNGPNFLIIDCPPSLGLLTLSSMTVANKVLIPIRYEFYALEDVTQLVNNVQTTHQHLNPELHISAVLLAMFDGHTRLSEEVANKVRNYFGGVVLRNLILRSVEVSETPGYSQAVISYDPGSRSAIAYLDTAEELATRGDYPTVPGGSVIGQKSASSPAPSNSTERN